MKYQYGASGAIILKTEKLKYSNGVNLSNINPRMTCNLTRASLARNMTTSRLSYGRNFRQHLIRKAYKEY